MYIKYCALYSFSLYKCSQWKEKKENRKSLLQRRFIYFNSKGWARPDLNRRPTGYEPVAPPV
jgi:hypothetical protein